MNRVRNFAAAVVFGGILGLAVGCGSGSSSAKPDAMKGDKMKEDGMKGDGMKSDDKMKGDKK